MAPLPYLPTARPQMPALSATLLAVPRITVYSTNHLPTQTHSLDSHQRVAPLRRLHLQTASSVPKLVLQAASPPNLAHQKPRGQAPRILHRAPHSENLPLYLKHLVPLQSQQPVGTGNGLGRSDSLGGQTSSPSFLLLAPSPRRQSPQTRDAKYKYRAFPGLPLSEGKKGD